MAISFLHTEEPGRLGPTEIDPCSSRRTKTNRAPAGRTWPGRSRTSAAPIELFEVHPTRLVDEVSFADFGASPHSDDRRTTCHGAFPSRLLGFSASVSACDASRDEPRRMDGRRQTRLLVATPCEKLAVFVPLLLEEWKLWDVRGDRARNESAISVASSSVALVHCRECGKEARATAPACPDCGRPFATPAWLKALPRTVEILGVLAAFGGIAMMTCAPHDDSMAKAIGAIVFVLGLGVGAGRASRGGGSAG